MYYAVVTQMCSAVPNNAVSTYVCIITRGSQSKIFNAHLECTVMLYLFVQTLVAYPIEFLQF